MNKRYTDAHVRGEMVEHSKKYPLPPLTEAEGKKLGYTLHHYWTKDASARYSYGPPPPIKAHRRYSADEFISILIAAIGDTSQRAISLDMGHAPTWLNKVLTRKTPPSEKLARTYGFERIKEGTGQYYFIKR